MRSDVCHICGRSLFPARGARDRRVVLITYGEGAHERTSHAECLERLGGPEAPLADVVAFLQKRRKALLRKHPHRSNARKKKGPDRNPVEA